MHGRVIRHVLTSLSVSLWCISASCSCPGHTGKGKRGGRDIKGMKGCISGKRDADYTRQRIWVACGLHWHTDCLRTAPLAGVRPVCKRVHRLQNWQLAAQSPRRLQPRAHGTALVRHHCDFEPSSYGIIFAGPWAMPCNGCSHDGCRGCSSNRSGCNAVADT